MKCVSGFELQIIHETLEIYDLTETQMVFVLSLIEKRAMNTSLPFSPYTAAHVAASQVLRETP